MTRLPLDFFKHLPPRFIPLEELFAPLPLLQRGHHGLKQHRYFLHPLGEGALGQGDTVMRALLAEPRGGTAIEVVVQQHRGPQRYPQGTVREHARRGRRRHAAWDRRTPARLVITATLDASKRGLDLHCNAGGFCSTRKRGNRLTTGWTACLRGAQVMHFGYDQQGRTLTAAMALATGLLPPMARTRRLGRRCSIRICRCLALGAVETLGQVADRCLKRCHLCRQGCFALDRPRVLRLPVIRLPRERDRGLLREHHTLLRKRGGVVAVARRQIRDGLDMGVRAWHGERYTRFFWHVLVFMMGVLGSSKLYVVGFRDEDEFGLGSFTTNWPQRNRPLYQYRAEHRRAGDGFQRPLRSRFQPRLTPSVRVRPLTVQQIVLAKNHTWTTV